MNKSFKIHVFLLFVFFASGSTSAKNHLPNDSPLRSVERYISQDDTVGLKQALTKINNEFIKFQNDYVGEILIRACSKAEKSGMKNLDLFYSLVRQFYINKGNRLKSLEFALKQYQELSKHGNSEGLAWILIDIGNLFYDEGEYSQAINFYTKAKNIAIKENNSDVLAVIFMNFGLTYKYQKQFDLAISNFRKSSFHRLKSNNKRINAATYVQMASTFLDMENLDSAYNFLNLAEKVYYDDKLGVSLVDEIPMYIDIERFRFFVLKKDFLKAEYHFQKGQKLAKKLNLEYDYNCNFYIKAKALSSVGQNQNAIKATILSIDYFHKNKMIYDECVIYQYLGDLYFEVNDFKNASKYFKLFSIYYEKVRFSDLSIKKGMLRSVAEVYESQINLEKTKKVLEVQKLQNNLRVRQKNISQLISLVFALVIFILLYLFFNSRKNSKKLLLFHNQLKSQNLEIQSNSVALERSNLIKDKLFSIIAHDLRNPLNRLMSQLAIAQKDSPNQQFLTPMEQTLKETINLFEGLLQWSRLDSKDNIYSPSKVSINENLNKIISFYLPEIQDKNIQILNQNDDFLVKVDQNVLQTVLRNIMSNSIASLGKSENKRSISFTTRLIAKDQVEISVVDSGDGFDENTISAFENDLLSNGKGLGLSLCKVLVKLGGWKMSISNSLENSNAKIVIQLPLYTEVLFEEEALIDFVLEEDWKLKLTPLKDLKVYQNSQIRLFVKNLGEISNQSTQFWIEKLLEAVRIGDENTFNKLLQLLKNED